MKQINPIRFKGIQRGRHAIATYIRPELLENLNHIVFQELGKQAIEKAVKIREDDAIAVPIEKVKEFLRDAVRKVIYVDAETHEKWVAFPKQLKDYLHYWTNIKLSELLKDFPQTSKTEEREKRGTNILAFYLFGKTAEIYKQGFINGTVLLSVLQELYENQQDEIPVLTNKQYTKLKEEELGKEVKIYLNFKLYPELRDWYATLPMELKRGVWVRTSKKLLDKLQNLWYNILHQNQVKEVLP
jgi:hypothetical protein